MYALRLRSPHSNPRIFVRPVNPAMRFIVVPKRFHEAVGYEINNAVQLQDPVGNTFNLSYYFNQGDHRIGAGLFNILSVHEIQHTVMVHFLYRGQARFNIHIFDPFSRDIRYNLAHQLPPQINLIIDDAEDNDNTSSDEEANYEHQDAPWVEKIWETDITAAQIYDHQTVTISSHVQQTFFPNLPPVINVLLPDDTIARWHITWRLPRHPTVGASGNGGRIGELAAGWCDFYMNNIINHDNYGQVHRIELWQSSESDTYIVYFYDV